MIHSSDLIAIGTLTRPHGHRGQIQCRMLNDYWDRSDPEFIFLQLNDLYVPYRVLDSRGKGADSLIFSLRGIDTEPAAAALTGAAAYMLRRDMVSDEESYIAWSDLVSYSVIDQDQGPLGTVTHVDEQTINTLLTLDNGLLIPIHEDFILNIDTEHRELHINLPFQLTDMP